MAALWQKLDVSQKIPFHIRVPEDKIYYAREYTADGGFQASEANSLILNLKKPISRRGQRDWYYKEQAIKRFARELSEAVKDTAVLAAIPSSKSESDPEYDSRLEDVIAQAKRLKPSLVIEKPFVARETMTPSHQGGSRSPDEIYDNLVWRGFRNLPNHILLVDDVLTTGAHFRACKRLILEHHPDLRVVGVFWGKTIWPDPPQ